MRKLIAGLIAGFLLVALSCGTAYSHERGSHNRNYSNGKAAIRTSPRISLNLASLGIRLNFSRDRRSVWIPGRWQRVNYRRGYVWAPGRFEKRAKYYPQQRPNGYCER